MPAITVKMKDGLIREFPETSASGGSWTTSIRYEGEFAIIEDAYGYQTAIPSHNIDEIKINSARRGRW